MVLFMFLEPKDHFYAKNCTCRWVAAVLPSHAKVRSSICVRLLRTAAPLYKRCLAGHLQFCKKKYPAYCRAYGYLHISLFKIRDFHDYFMSALSLRFSKDIVDVALHGILGYRKLSCYLRIAESSVQKEQHFPFSSGELIPV